MAKFGDPTFEYHIALASVMGLLTLRLADAPVMSFRFEEYAESLYTYAKDLKGFITQEVNGDDSLAPLFSAIQDYSSSASKIDAEIQDAEAAVHGQARRCRQWHRQLFLQSDALYSSHGDMSMDCPQTKALNLSSLNDRIMFAERHFLDPEGIPGREWYKHVVYAPDEWAGYSAAMFPSLKDVLKSGNMSAIAERVERVSKVLRAAASQLLAT
jgi:N-acetylated-alpha-linked acidic dipeptidase